VKTGEIFPTDIVPVIADGRDLRPAVFPMRWGFTSARGGSALINARSETAGIEASVPPERAKQRRCLLPATNYFEWERDSGGKTKYSIKMPGEGIMYLAGLYTRSEQLSVR
jgi:putative SOS response-associated peptidase YedK